MERLVNAAHAAQPGMERDMNNILIEVPKNPACLDDYLPFQIGGVFELCTRKNVLLADEMGLGKTIQVLGYINVKKPRSILIVCPKVAMLNWERESRKWLLPEYLKECFDDEIEIASADFCYVHNFLICSYESLAKWIDIIAKEEWDLVVLDEMHMIKTATAKRSVAARAVCLRGSKIVGVTGSPILNYPRELFPMLVPLKYDGVEQLWPQISSAEPFLYRYTFGTNNNRLRNGDELGRKLRECFMIRRLKKEVLTELPRKRRQIVEVKVEDEKLRKLLEHEKKLFEGKNRSVDDILEKLVEEANSAGAGTDFSRELSAIAENEIDWNALVESMKYTKQYFFEEMSRVRHETALAKVPFAIEHIENIFEGSSENGDKSLVVFCHHKDVMRKISEHFNERGITNCIVDGSVSLLDRQQMIDDFQAGKIQLFIGGIKAVGVAVTLTRASHCVFVEVDWSPPIITQAEDRLHRIGQDESVLIQHLVFEDSFDSFIARKVVNKQKQIEKVLSR